MPCLASDTNRLLERCCNFNSLVDALDQLSNEHQTGVTFLSKGRDGDHLSYAELRVQALSLLHAFQKQGLQPGDELVFQLTDERAFITTFWACLYGGVIPIPVTLGFHEEFRFKLFKILDQLQRPRLIIGGEGAFSLEKFAVEHQLEEDFARLKQNILNYDHLIGDAKKAHINTPASNDLAFVQYSSGSTGDPKGVMLTHANLLSNINAIIRGAQVEGGDSTLSWMPLTHDMGLIGFHLVPLTAGISQYLMPPARFLRNPVGWLGKAHKYKVTLLASPNFGYRHFLGAFKRYTERNWDLSHVRLILNGAEPISSELMDEFTRELALFGLDASAMFPVYGMAEASLAVTFPPVGELPRSLCVDRDTLAPQKAVDFEPPEAIHLGSYVDLGFPVQDCEVRIHDDNDTPLEEGKVGHIQIRGGNVTSGYYRNQEASRNAFTKDGWLKTGDLGLFYQGRLVVTGRTKDIIFKHGVNYYAHDLERVAEQVEGVESGKVLFCGPNQDRHESKLVVGFIAWRGPLKNFVVIAERVKKHIGRYLGLEVDAVIPIRKLPRTTSGKLQRYLMEESWRKGLHQEEATELERLQVELSGQRVVVSPRTSTEKRLATLWSDLLDYPQVSIDDSFFELGGDSLKACTLAVKIGHVFQTRVTLQEFFEFQTLREMAHHIDRAREHDFSIITALEPREYYPLSSEQKRLFFLHQIDQLGLAYNMYLRVNVKGKLKESKLREALNQLVSQREILRTSFIDAAGEPVMKVQPQLQVDIHKKSLREQDLEDALISARAPFTLSLPPLFRVHLFRMGSDHYTILLEFHHIICDGTSMGVFLDEWFHLYGSGSLKNQLLAFRDYAVWQGSFINSPRVTRMEHYWRGKLGQNAPRLQLRADFPRPATRDERGGRCSFKIEGALLADLKWISRNNQTTISMVLVALYQILLAKYTGQDDLLMGAIMAGRNHHGLETVLGMFAKTVVLRTQPQGEKPFDDYLRETRQEFFEVHANQDYPFEKVVDIVGGERELGRNPVFDVMFVFQNFRIPDVRIPEIQLTEVPYFSETANFDLTLEARETEDALTCCFQYARALFRHDAIERMVRHFLSLAEQICWTPTIRLSKLRMISEEETRQILEDFNRTRTSFAESKTLACFFEEQVEKYGELPAIRSDHHVLNYQKANHRANQIARALRREGVRPETVVGLMLDPSIEMLIGMLAILKAGAAYLPIDTDYPPARKQFLLEDAGAILLLTAGDAPETPEYKGSRLALDDTSWWRDEHTANLKLETFSRDLAYIIYTSGTTGKPKGVRVEHRSLMNLLHALHKVMPTDQGDAWMFKTSFTFDASAHDLFLWFFGGASVYIAPKKIDTQPEKYTALLHRERITHTGCVPSVTRLWLSRLNQTEADQLHCLRYYITGGEALTNQLASQFLSFFPNVALINAYGPTETTVVSSCEEVVFLDRQNTPTIGRPIQNTRIYILNETHQIQPIGVPGEIFISGVGVARGYQNQSELTRDRFIDDPWQPGRLMYRTGDLGFWLPDGRVGFLGRIDHQVKLRGLRIELEEIQTVLAQHPQVQRTAVIDVRQDDDVALCAYYVAKERIEPSDLRDFLAKSIPLYMIPTHFFKMDDLPLSNSGKLDRHRLPDPSQGDVIRARYQEPRNEVDKVIIEIWQQMLGVQDIGVNDHFFELGGHSLLAARVIGAISQKLDLEANVSLLFEAPRVGELADLLIRAQKRKTGGVIDAETMQRLASLLGKEPHIIERTINDRPIRFLFSDNHKALQHIAEELPSNQQPHYIFPVKEFRSFQNNSTLASLKLWQSLSETACELEPYRDGVVKWPDQLNQTLLQGIVSCSYECGHHPKWFIERNIRSIIFTEIPFSTGPQPNQVLDALNALIQKQSLLRSQLVRETEGLRFREYKDLKADHITLIDLTRYHPDCHERAIETIRSWMRKALLATSPLDHLLFNAVLIKLNHMEVRFLLAFDHIIADHDSGRVANYHFRMLESARAQQSQPSFNYPVETYQTFTHLTWEGEQTERLEQFKQSPEYTAYRDLAVDLQGRYGKGQAIVFSEPMQLEMDLGRSERGMAPNTVGAGLAVAAFVLSALFKTDHIPLRVLTNRRIFRGKSFYNTIGDFHDSLPIVFQSTNLSPETAWQTMRTIERKFSSAGYYVSKFGEDQEVYQSIFKSPFNFNYVGELSPREEEETLAGVGVFPFVSYPIFAYQSGSKLGMIFFHGMNEECIRSLRHFLDGSQNTYSIRNLHTRN